MDVYDTPELTSTDKEVLALIAALRSEMQHRVSEPRRWYGSLRKVTFVRAVQGSNSIEGYNASLDDAAAAMDGEPTLEADVETQQALAGYRDAMTYVLQVARDEQAAIDEGLIKSLHFMMIKHDLAKCPGRWRPGDIHVFDEAADEIVYTGPDAELVPELIEAMVRQLKVSESPVLVRAAMAHLNLAMIHPFRDGNGRMARCLQTLVLAKEQIVAPVFSSIEEYLGRNTRDYYEILGSTGRGVWSPSNDATDWVRFCLTAHYRQARTHLRRIEEIETLWTQCVRVATDRGLNERVAAGLVEVALGFRLRRGTYREAVRVTDGEEITELTSTRDLQAMVKAGLLEAVGERRGRYYVAAKSVSAIRDRVRAGRAPKLDDDPFEMVSSGEQLTLDD